MAALMRQRVVLVFTHDSIGLGEDGPTHQPIEHLASLRLIPNMTVWRPCDTVESAVAWARRNHAHDGPTSLVLTRQGLPHCRARAAQLAAIVRGGYVAQDCAGSPECVLHCHRFGGRARGRCRQGAGGRRAAACVSSRCPARVCSTPRTTAYRASVLPAGVPRVAIEAGVRDGWYRYVGPEGAVIGMTTFGASAPASKLFEHFGFTVSHVIETVRGVLRH